MDIFTAIIAGLAFGLFAIVIATALINIAGTYTHELPDDVAPWAKNIPLNITLGLCAAISAGVVAYLVL